MARKKPVELQMKISSDVAELKKGLAQINKGVKTFNNDLSSIAQTALGAFSVDRLVSYGREASKLAGQAEGIRKAFDRIGGGQYFDELREATRGTVSDVQLMRNAVQARNFDIPLKSLASLFEFATKRAQETGESVEYLTNSIILGIGRKSPLILDNLGISAIRLRKELKGAGTEAATVADVAAAVGKIAQTEMEKAGDIIDTTAIKTAQWGATWDNITEKIGNLINKGLNKIAPAVDTAFKTLDKVITQVFGGKEAAIKVNIEGNLQGFETQTAEEQILQLQLWEDEIDNLVEKIKDVNKQIEQIGEIPWYGSREELNKAENNLSKYNKQLSVLQGTIAEIRKPTPTVEQIEPPPPPPPSKFDASKFFVKDEELVDRFNEIVDAIDVSLDDSYLSQQLGDFADEAFPIIDKYSAAIDEASEKVRNMADTWSVIAVGAITGFGTVFGSVLAGQKAGLKEFVTSALSGIQSIINAKLAEAIAGMIAGEAKRGLVGLITASVGVAALLALWQSKVPKFALGGLSSGGLSLVGENGPELVNLPPGARVYNNAQSMGMNNKLIAKGVLTGDDIRLSVIQANNRNSRLR